MAEETISLKGNEWSSFANLKSVSRKTRKILYIQYTNPAAFPPLEHSSQILANDGWSVLFLGIGAMGGADALRFAQHERVDVRQMAFCKRGLMQKLHYVRFTLWTLAWAIWWRPEWLYASDLLSCPAARLINLLLGVKVIYHEHDSPEATGATFFMRICLSARKQLARHSQICILPNEQRASIFAEQTGAENMLCVWNCPARAEAEMSGGDHENEAFWVLYHGSIVPPRLPETVLFALTMLPERVKLRVIGYETVGHLGYVEELREMAMKLGIANRMEFLGSIPTRGELLELCRKSDVGLAFMPENGGDINLRYMAGASNKPFDYLASGLTLLVTDLPEWRKMFVEPGYALACDPKSAESIASALRWLIDHPEQARQMGELGREKIIAEWHYEKAFSPVIKRLSTHSFQESSNGAD